MKEDCCLYHLIGVPDCAESRGGFWAIFELVLKEIRFWVKRPVWKLRNNPSPCQQRQVRDRKKISTENLGHTVKEPRSILETASRELPGANALNCQSWLCLLGVRMADLLADSVADFERLAGGFSGGFSSWSGGFCGGFLRWIFLMEFPTWICLQKLHRKCACYCGAILQACRGPKQAMVQQQVQPW